eukprot:COSAG01_NODE_3019_length_6711_cov_12.281004_2_plen_131_part_00
MALPGRGDVNHPPAPSATPVKAPPLGQQQAGRAALGELGLRALPTPTAVAAATHATAHSAPQERMAEASVPKEAGALLHELAGMLGKMPRYNAASQVEIYRQLLEFRGQNGNSPPPNRPKSAISLLLLFL